MMYCGECGTKMERRPDGAWVLCCTGIGYWYDKPPIEGDLWAFSVQSIPGLWFYRTGKWPTNQAPAEPVR